MFDAFNCQRDKPPLFSIGEGGGIAHRLAYYAAACMASLTIQPLRRKQVRESSPPAFMAFNKLAQFRFHNG